MVARPGVEPGLRGYEPLVVPFHYLAVKMAPEAGVEPATGRLTADCTTTVLLWNGRRGGIRTHGNFVVFLGPKPSSLPGYELLSDVMVIIPD